MASSCLRYLTRYSLSSSRSNISQAIAATRRPPASSASTAGSTRSASGADFGAASQSPNSRYRVLSRSPVELGSCAGSMYPLHCAVAAARLTCRLSLTSRSCRDLLQGAVWLQQANLVKHMNIHHLK